MPWPCRTFPLAGEDLDNLDNENPSACVARTASSTATFTVGDPQDVEFSEDRVSEKASASSASSDSELGPIAPEQPQEDDEDEKWTVKLMTEVKSSPADTGTVRKGIVLKLAKK